jgi:pentachlorophenol monooxygenase
VLVDLAGSDAVRSAVDGWRERVKLVAAVARDSCGLAALLVRPDGVVAWACDGAPDLGALHAALARWFGQARERA